MWNVKVVLYFILFFQQIDSPSFGSMEVSDSEILDELTTNRGELKVRTLSFREERHGQVSGYYN
jgi:hypothetical protein